MDWSRAKTILIITFLCLNAFLIFQLIEKRNVNHMSVMAQDDHSFQQQLGHRNIELQLDDPEVNVESRYISGNGQQFGDEQQQAITEELDDQTVEFRRNGQLIESELDEPYELTGLDTALSAEAFMSDYLYMGDEYEFASYEDNEEGGGVIRAYQTFEGETLRYRDHEAHVVLELNDDGLITGYRQRYMNFSPQVAPELITPIEAVRVVVTEYGIVDAVIDEAELGHYNITPANMDAPEYYAPMWRISVDGDYFYVNAHNSEVWTD
ncbi:two-component system regulatory protein YycI [Alteribacter natronophilus]|uniref:two-component system regulatory protein YycI n=1 Tax=Alteribacter natronophilus TaxID=2583810 RepID=UPI00110F0552|nr:two-component system regulatory protein YycI [Alteribacter natronophilus]TMW72032.1 hypothetical protein FGB90_07370 [Alteribacter natronophilus]